jgi:lipid-A-disaccharide synthase
MLEQGLCPTWPMDTLTVRGLFEVLPRYRELKGIQNRLRDRLLPSVRPPSSAPTTPASTWGWKSSCAPAGIPTMHFVGPQIWAWRGGRIKKIQRAVSHMLVIFPFEEEIYRQAGVPATYIGHPLAEQIPLQPDVAAARRQLGIAGGCAKVVTVMPGSRMAEIKYLAEPFAGAVQLLAQRDPERPLHRADGGRAPAAYFMELAGEGRPGRCADAADRRPVARGASRRPTRCWSPPARRRWKWRCSRSRW